VVTTLGEVMVEDVSRTSDSPKQTGQSGFPSLPGPPILDDLLRSTAAGFRPSLPAPVVGLDALPSPDGLPSDGHALTQRLERISHLQAEAARLARELGLLEDLNGKLSSSSDLPAT
jgi:hypothetical protein